MKTLKITIILTLAILIVSVSQAQAFSIKGEKAVGVNGLGYYELNTDWESLYFNFALAGTTQTAGFGFGTFFELGVSDKMAIELDLGYSRLIYANRQRTIAKENYFTGDVVGHYYFVDNDMYRPYLIFGIGTIASTGSVVPLADLGLGMQFRLTEDFSIKTELLVKSAVIFNRAEGRVGLAYHF